jgi:hypothetical protein
MDLCRVKTLRLTPETPALPLSPTFILPISAAFIVSQRLPGAQCCRFGAHGAVKIVHLQQPMSALRSILRQAFTAPQSDTVLHDMPAILSFERSKLVIAVMPKPDLRDELSKIEAEPLLPIEKKLIGWSLGIGVTLLIILAIVNHFFPAAP